MTHRKEVFQLKVLQKLYPAAPKLEKEPSSPCIQVDTLLEKKLVNRKTSHQDIPHSNPAVTSSTGIQSRRIYTVLPPPEDYQADSVESVTLPELETINNVEGPSEHGVQESSEELDEAVATIEEKKRRKRRLKFHGEKAPTSTVQNGTPTDEEVVHISRNKKRKLKKKRHKEKMLSMGLMPRASALEFTYERENDEAEVEENGIRASEVADFLRTTMEIYKSDSLLHAEKLPQLSSVLENLLSSIISGSRPASLLNHLYALQQCIQHENKDRLEKALQNLCNNTMMAAEETTAVATLFQYWITDILPIKEGKETKLS
ncbi:glutamate-rich protein 1 [Syngnathoides biaculeatus]|uniref:glutamate-rich protein 1 n=1 Tax=Syngnathoides biaculeatus TaxID=300417 RepID=UPI002ADE1F18|nr:glutamate-rich protein 1 [Syngnathoides biaculeatus]